MEKFRFKNWPVYKDSRDLRNKVKGVLKKFPKEERFELTSQMRRALNSILLNIAEGSDQGTDRHKAQYMGTALGSANEVMASLDIALDDGYINPTEYQELKEDTGRVAKQLMGFKRKLKKDSFK